MNNQATKHALHIVLDDNGFSIEEEYAVFLKTQSTTTRRIIDGPFRHLDTAENHLYALIAMTTAEFKGWLLANNLPVLIGTIPIPTDSPPPIALTSITLDHT